MRLCVCVCVYAQATETDPLKEKKISTFCKSYPGLFSKIATNAGHMALPNWIYIAFPKCFQPAVGLFVKKAQVLITVSGLV